MGLICPCKFKLGISNATATIRITKPDGSTTDFTSTIDFSAEQCFVGAAKCQPSVNNFKMTFGKPPGNTINLNQGRRGMIACVDHTVATLTNGTAKGAGNTIPKINYTVDFSYTIDPLTNTATFHLKAVGEDGTIVETMPAFTTSVSPETFIGSCTDTVGPQ